MKKSYINCFIDFIIFFIAWVLMNGTPTTTAEKFLMCTLLLKWIIPTLKHLIKATK